MYTFCLTWPQPFPLFAHLFCFCCVIGDVQCSTKVAALSRVILGWRWNHVHNVIWGLGGVSLTSNWQTWRTKTTHSTIGSLSLCDACKRYFGSGRRRWRYVNTHTQLIKNFRSLHPLYSAVCVRLYVCVSMTGYQQSLQVPPAFCSLYVGIMYIITSNLGPFFSFSLSPSFHSAFAMFVSN